MRFCRRRSYRFFIIIFLNMKTNTVQYSNDNTCSNKEKQHKRSTKLKALVYIKTTTKKEKHKSKKQQQKQKQTKNKIIKKRKMSNGSRTVRYRILHDYGVFQLTYCTNTIDNTCWYSGSAIIKKCLPVCGRMPIPRAAGSARSNAVAFTKT